MSENWQNYPCILGRNVNPDTGYSQTSIRIGDETKTFGSHVLAYTVFVGPIPQNKQLDHLCRNRACVEWHHVEPVTPQENQLRSELTVANKNMKKTYCPKGHLYDYVEPKGSRGCKRCRAEASRRAYMRRKGKV